MSILSVATPVPEEEFNLAISRILLKPATVVTSVPKIEATEPRSELDIT